MGDYPGPNSPEMLTACVAYFLYLCWPEDDAKNEIHDPHHVEHLRLYTEMSWIILQTTCLICEYWRGSNDKKSRWFQPGKCILGAIELYFSFFCYRIYTFQYPAVGELDFPNWHQLYMWDAINCKELYPESAQTRGFDLIAEAISPENMYSASIKLVERTGRYMCRNLERFDALAQHINGVPNDALGKYYIRPKHIRQLTVLMRKCVRARTVLFFFKTDFFF